MSAVMVGSALVAESPSRAVLRPVRPSRPAASKGRQPQVDAEPRRTIEPQDYCAMILRCLRAMGRRAGEADPESLTIFPELRRAIDAAEHHAIQALLDEGYSFDDMARPLRVTRAAVHKRYHSRRGAE